MKFIGYKVPQCVRMLFRSFQFLVFIFSNGILFVCFILCSHDQAYIYFMVMKRKLLIAPHTTKFILPFSHLSSIGPQYTHTNAHLVGSLDIKLICLSLWFFILCVSLFLMLSFVVCHHCYGKLLWALFHGTHNKVLIVSYIRKCLLLNCITLSIGKFCSATNYIKRTFSSWWSTFEKVK